MLIIPFIFVFTIVQFYRKAYSQHMLGFTQESIHWNPHELRLLKWFEESGSLGLIEFT